MQDMQAAARQGCVRQRPGAHTVRKQARRKQTMDWINDYLRSHPCVDCGEIDPIVLEFDHVSGKEHNISSMLTYSLDRIKQEIERCEVRCANCHCRVTHARRGSYRWAVGELADPSGSDPEVWRFEPSAPSLAAEES
jgi:hypothetical protein